jgi:hypothetical protein
VLILGADSQERLELQAFADEPMIVVDAVGNHPQRKQRVMESAPTGLPGA